MVGRARLVALGAMLVLAGCGGDTAGSRPSPGSWRQEASGTQHRLYDVACLTPLHCEAVGDAGTIVSTNDGGATWKAQVSPLRASSNVLYRITCMQPSSCYVIARPDTILVTHDAGLTWSSRVLPVDVPGSSLTDEHCLPSYTPIGGREALCRLGLLDIACVSDRVCFAVATAPAAYDVQPIPQTQHVVASAIWMTVDGGASWTAQPVPAGVGCNGDCAAGLYAYPLVWVSCVTGGVCRAGGGHALGCGHCGFAYAVLVTAGPGAPWTCPAPSTACTTLSPDAADCPGSTSCYGIQSTNPFGTDNLVARSTDGGAAWTQIGPGWSAGVLNDVTCPGALTCYVVGTRGTIARITDGDTVSQETTPAAGDLFGIGCAGPAACYAVGDSGTILAGP